MMKFNIYTLRIGVLLFIVAAFAISYEVYQQIMYLKEEGIYFVPEFNKDDDDETKYDYKLKFAKNSQEKAENKKHRIKAQIKYLNTNLKIYNTYWGPIINNETFVLVIQCHKNVFYLRQLIDALSRTFFINSAFIIFSHDYYSKEINQVISNVTFAEYIQIFYPHSIQMHPNVFPGPEPQSCIKGFRCTKTTYRDPEAIQSKHHWWWQTNQVFDHIEVLKNFTDPILFLEENNYVTEDVLVVFRLLKYARDIHCPFCEMISLGAHEPDKKRYTRLKNTVAIEPWADKTPRTGIAFDRKSWLAIKKYKEEFCYHNDSRWDKSLKYLGSKKLDEYYLTAIDGPRVFHLENCDKKNASCSMQNKLDKVRDFIKVIKKQLYPYNILIKVLADNDFSPITPSGAFSDPRDHELCMHFAKYCVWS